MFIVKFYYYNDLRCEHEDRYAKNEIEALTRALKELNSKEEWCTHEGFRIEISKKL